MVRRAKPPVTVHLVQHVSGVLSSVNSMDRVPAGTISSPPGSFSANGSDGSVWRCKACPSGERSLNLEQAQGYLRQLEPRGSAGGSPSTPLRPCLPVQYDDEGRPEHVC